jgi:predicted phage terminase large subunit-like protein
MNQQETTEIRPTPKQREAKKLLDQNSILVFGGGIRSGKSFFLLLTILTYCFEYDKSRWLILRKDLPTLKRNLFPTFNQILALGLGQYVKEWNQSTQTVTFTNGSEIIFMAESYDTDKELNRFRGLEINGAGIDEINEIQQETFYKIIERAGSWTQSKAPIKIIGTCNPSHGWVKELFYDKWRDGKLKKGWCYVPALLIDNPYISKEYIESLKANMPDYQYEIFVNGNWDLKLEGVLFARSDLKRFSKKDFKEDGLESTLSYADVADEGDDSFSMPVGKIFKKKVFITDILFSKENTDFTKPIVAGMVKDLKVNYLRVESNNQGSVFIKELRQLVQPEKVLKVSNHANKHTRILMEYGFIKEYFYFLDDIDIIPGSDYDKFMREMLSYMKDGTSKHDDAIDSISGLAKFIQSFVPHLFTA